MNFVFWLRDMGFKTFAEWLSLNSCVRDELKGLTIRELQQEKKSHIISLLKGFYKETFLQMTEKDEQVLQSYKILFKDHKKRYAMLTFLCTHMHFEDSGQGESKNWKSCFSTIKYFKDSLE